MFESYASGAISAKARSIYGRRLTREDYLELLRKHSVGAIAGYLKNETAYRDCLSSVVEGLIHRGQLEKLLSKEAFERILRLRHYAPGSAVKGRSFYDYFLIQLEISEILDCVGYLNAGAQDQFITALPNYAAPYLKIDLFKMAAVHDFDQLCGCLKGTPYLPIVRNWRPFQGANIDILSLEHDLYLYYYKTIFSMARKLDRESCQKVTNLFSARAEIRNIITIYRLKRFFRFPPEKIKPLLIPVRLHFSKAKTAALVEAAAPEELLSLLEGSVYTRRLDIEQAAVFDEVESRNVFRFARSGVRAAEHPAVVFSSFCFLQQLETENIVNIIEGVRYNVLPGEIEKLLIF